MPDGLAAALALPGLWPLAAVTLIAGIVYGFAGFGSALVFMPLATAVVAPEVAVAAFSCTAVISALTLVPRAWPAADRRAVAILLAAALAMMPAGVWLLRAADPTVLRYAISALVAVTLAAMAAGWRFSAAPHPALRAAVGGATGLVGAATGLMGPIVILLNLGGGAPAREVRANTLVFLTFVTLLLLPVMALQGALSPAALWLGLLLTPPYGLGGLIGQRLFDPAREALYRRVAYGVILAALVAGLPVWA